MNRELLAAVQKGSLWLEKFTRKDYAGAFRAYTERFGPLYMAAVRETGGGEAALNALASDLLDGLEQGWKAQRFWNRSAAKVSDKQMLVDYWSPMLLGLEEPGCADLAELLRAGWAARWPREAYRIAPYAQIQRGFRNTILGFEMSGGGREEDR